MDRILIIIPVYNEEKNIAEVISDIRENCASTDILVINDNSTDKTVEKLESIGIDYLDLPFNMGYAGALQAGFKYSREKNYDYVIQFDGDGQHMAKEIRKLYDHIKMKKADIVIGSRFKINTDYPHPLFRKIGSKIFSSLIKITTGKNITDPTSGFQILAKNVYKNYSEMFNYPQFPDANLIIKMLLLGYKIEEIPVKMKERKHGESMHTGIIGPVKYMIKIFYSILITILFFVFGSLRKAGGQDV